MAVLLRLLIPALLLGALVWIVVRAFRGSGAAGAGPTGDKCASCRYCRTVFHDGTLCSFGPREVFKNEVHVSNCVDYRRKG